MTESRKRRSCSSTGARTAASPRSRRWSARAVLSRRDGPSWLRSLTALLMIRPSRRCSGASDTATATIGPPQAASQSRTVDSCPGASSSDSLRSSASVVAATRGVDALVSGLGTTKGGAPDTLTRGARAAVASGVPRIVWLSAFGTGASAGAAGPVWPRALRLMLGKEVGDEEDADEVVLGAGGTSVHAGILTHGDPAARPRAVRTSEARSGLFPGRISRSTVAAAMLDQAEDGGHHGEVLVAAG